MNLTREKALQHFTGTSQVVDLSIASLQQLADTYPYFMPAQFFLAAGLKQQSQSAAASQVVKTALYFTNPHWLQFQLLGKTPDGQSAKTTTPLQQLAEKASPALTSLRETMRSIEEADSIDDEPEEFMTEEESLPEPGQEAIIESKLSGILSGQLADFKKPVAAEDKLEIEADEVQRLHTIDYFASQGIKIDLSKIPKDKLTTNLLKFTDWLKQMKNPNPAHVDLGTSTEMENAVMEIAKTSNVSREVLTEAMAEVLVKQGQTEKAIQLLIKLSFINPEKSSYFAARIEQLKGII